MGYCTTKKPAVGLSYTNGRKNPFR